MPCTRVSSAVPGWAQDLTQPEAWRARSPARQQIGRGLGQARRRPLWGGASPREQAGLPAQACTDRRGSSSETIRPRLVRGPSRPLRPGLWSSSRKESPRQGEKRISLSGASPSASRLSVAAVAAARKAGRSARRSGHPPSRRAARAAGGSPGDGQRRYQRKIGQGRERLVRIDRAGGRMRSGAARRPGREGSGGPTRPSCPPPQPRIAARASRARPA